MKGFIDYLKHPEWRRQHGWRRALWHSMSRMGLTGLHGLPLNRRWIEIHRRRMPLRGLAPSHTGLKLVQISDLHHSPVVSERYLVQYVRWVNDLEPDIVCITGDLITGGYRYATRVARILSHIKARHAVVCTFGNHDYSMFGKHHPSEGTRRGDHLERALEDRGLVVLRNETLRIDADDGPPLVLVGLDDEWSNRIDPEKAFARVDPAEPVICLNHNPVNTLDLLRFPWQWMLAGHTHGRQLATSRLGRRLYPRKFRNYTHGYYAVQGRHLYVNRGLSYGQRVLSWCRPEITVFRLTPDDGHQPLPTDEVVTRLPAGRADPFEPSSSDPDSLPV